MNSKTLRIKQTLSRFRAKHPVSPRFHKILLIFCGFAILGAPLCGFAADPSRADDARLEQYRRWLSEMKVHSRGPFDQIRWFCKDGTRLLPTPGACIKHGGGNQHGQWSPRTLELREAGYRIANFFADLDLDALLAAPPSDSSLEQMLIEQFLRQADDGWILRQARYYRGAYQEEGERKGARALLLRLLGDDSRVSTRYLLLRSAVAMLPHGPETTAVREIRQVSASLSERDLSFKPLRNKIHGRMERGDAAAVRAFAASSEKNITELFELADKIDALFAQDATRALPGVIEKLPAGASRTELSERLAALQSLPNSEVTQRAERMAALLYSLRIASENATDAGARLALLDSSIALENDYFRLLGEVSPLFARWTRRQQVTFAGSIIDALYGTGLLSARQHTSLQQSWQTLLAGTVTPSAYKQTADYLALVPHWATQALHLHFGLGIAKLGEIEPKTVLFAQDTLRGSPLFHFAALVDRIVRDANRVSGVRNELFGEDVGGGVRGLNPGLAHGVLHLVTDAPSKMAFDRQGIYVLPETVSDLPPVAGIITAGEGNPLSHVQLLARNLGIPNIALEQRLIDKLKPHAESAILIAVSPAGSVRITPYDAAAQALFATQTTGKKPVITVDLNKLNLEVRELIDLSTLRATDSGRIVGPKAAKLGELKFHYPDAVASGVALPFGLFRAALEQAHPSAQGSIFEWMQREYARLATLPAETPQTQAAIEQFRSELEALITNLDPGETFKSSLRSKLREIFGASGTYGVFVRSDTNVEDLPGFTGAGLNLTVPNVVGEDEIIRAISQVWASPFTARSFAWRQSLMTTPEHVYPAVLLLKSVDNEKSGVLVTRDIDSGSAEWLSVALNEGVGGAVDGQSAESVRIRMDDGHIRLLAQATAPLRRQLAKTGGVDLLRTSGHEQVLAQAEALKLVELARELPQRFPPIVDAAGLAAPADIEFGFLRGELQLFQIRPFLDNAQALSMSYLTQMDAARGGAAATVDMEQVP